MMKVAFSARGLNAYPHVWGGHASEETVRRVLGWARAVGFDGFEVEDSWVDFYRYNDGQVREFRSTLDGVGMPAAAFKTGGRSLCHPSVRDENLEKMLRAVEIAAILGTDIISISLPAPLSLYGVSSEPYCGMKISYGASRDAPDRDFQTTADSLAMIADKAAGEGISIAIEIHQNSVADNSAATLRLVEMAGRDNIGINPDLGNIYWTYEEPEEPWQEAIQRLAPRSIWWHCKNLRRVHVGELGRSIFLRCPLPDGDIDYRFAIEAMHKAGYQGYILLEGADAGDQFEWARRGLEYVRSVLATLEP